MPRQEFYVVLRVITEPSDGKKVTEAAVTRLLKHVLKPKDHEGVSEFRLGDVIDVTDSAQKPPSV